MNRYFYSGRGPEVEVPAAYWHGLTDFLRARYGRIQWVPPVAPTPPAALPPATDWFCEVIDLANRYADSAESRMAFRNLYGD